MQAVLPKEEVSIGIAIVNLFSFLGGSVLVTAGQALLEDELYKRLSPLIPNLDRTSLANGGATTVRDLVPMDQLPAVLVAYNGSMRDIWYLGLGAACLGFIATCFFEWKSVKDTKKKGDPENGGSGTVAKSSIEEEKTKQGGE